MGLFQYLWSRRLVHKHIIENRATNYLAYAQIELLAKLYVQNGGGKMRGVPSSYERIIQKEQTTLYTSETILAIGAHPDDIEVGCGGMLRVLVNLGYKVYGIVLTDGESGGDGERRLKEAAASARILGLEGVFFEHLEDGRLPFNIDTVTIMDRYIAKFKPQKVFTHSRNDRHQDHVNCSDATIAAARKGVKDILMYEVYGPTKPFFMPHFIMDVSETIECKLKAVKKHKSQIEKGTLNLQGLKEHAGSIGKEYGCRYAEAFEINHTLFNPERLKLELINQNGTRGLHQGDEQEL
jgi:LmbE family N-acetylglucosaminyl deacetylase